MIKKKKIVLGLILEGDVLGQLQKVDKDLKNVLMLFFKSCAQVLYDYWSGIGTCCIFSSICYQIFSVLVSGSKCKIKVMTKLYFSLSKVELLYLFERSMSYFLIQPF